MRSVWRRFLPGAAIVLAMVPALGTAARAAIGDGPDEPLVIAWQGGATTLDPIMRSENTTYSWQRHIFDTLTLIDRQGGVQPRIVTAWKNVDPDTWRLTLHAGVQFQDGSAMTAEDVGKSILDAKDNPKSQVREFVQGIKAYKVVDPTTLEVTFDNPDPILPLHLSYIPVMPETMIEKEGRDAFNRHPIGTGPYRFESWLAQDHLDAQAWPGYWGDKPEFKHVHLESIPNDATRLAALLSGQVQVAEKVGPEDFERVRSNGKTYLTMTPGIRTIYLAMDDWRETGSSGLPTGAKNPFLDPRVRKAVYQAIDVDLVRKKIFNGAVTTATQFLAPGIEGHDDRLQRFAADPEAAKKLLADAGYPDGFTVRLDATNDRYFQDSLVAQGIAGLMQEIGIKIEVNAIPKAVFFPKVDKGDFTLYMAGWAGPDGISTYGAMFHCRDEAHGFGHVNREHFCNHATDTMMAKAARDFDDAERVKAERQAYAIADREDVAYVPLYYENVIAGVVDGVAWQPRPDELIFAWQMKRK